MRACVSSCIGACSGFACVCVCVCVCASMWAYMYEWVEVCAICNQQFPCKCGVLRVRVNNSVVAPRSLQSTGTTSPYPFPMSSTKSLVKIDTAYKDCLIQFVHNSTGNLTMLYNEWCTESTMVYERSIHFLKY